MALKDLRSDTTLDSPYSNLLAKSSTSIISEKNLWRGENNNQGITIFKILYKVWLNNCVKIDTYDSKLLQIANKSELEVISQPTDTVLSMN